MINFIIYEDQQFWQNFYKNKIISKMNFQNSKYNIIIIDKYSKENKRKMDKLQGKRIFLLDIKVPGKEGLDFAREIRGDGDWTSPIIVISSHTSYKEEGFTSKILMLDFITKDQFLEEKLESALSIAIEILLQKNTFHFTYNQELHQIPYEDILYFEKNLNNNYLSIVTKRKTYTIKQSIKNIETSLIKFPHFFKTHQSCIVNLKNVKKVDFAESKIYFCNSNFTYLLSRSRKKVLKEKLNEGVVL